MCGDDKYIEIVINCPGIYISLFDSNFGAGGAAISIAYFNARFDNVRFRNNIGTAVQVSVTVVNA